MSTTNPGIKLGLAIWRWKQKTKICRQVFTRRPHGGKTGHFAFLRGRERLRKCTILKKARSKRANELFFIFKYANLWRSCPRLRLGCFQLAIADCRISADAIALIFFHYLNPQITSFVSSVAS